MERKEKLFEIALDEFIEKGYDKASLNNILKEAGISKGSFYYHFNNKQELYLYLFKTIHEMEHKYLNEWREKCTIDYENLNFFEILKVEGRVGLESAIENPKVYLFWKSIQEEKNPEVKRLMDNELNELIESGHAEDYLMPLIDRGLKNKDFREDVSKEFLIRMLCNSMITFFNCFMKEKADLEFENLEKNYEDYVDFLERGLGKKK